MTIKIITRQVSAQRDYTVHINVNETVEQLKKFLEEISNVPKNSMGLIFSGEELKDDVTLKNSGLRSNCVIHMVQRLNTSARNISLSSSGKKARKFHEPFGNESVFGFKRGKWIVQKFENGNVKIPDATSKHAVGIYDSKKTQVLISNKVNHVNIVNCTDCIVLLNGVIASLELTRCTNVTIISTGDIATVQLDLSRECHFVLKNFKSVHLVASSTESIRINGEVIETSIFGRDQRVTFYDGKTQKWKTVGSYSLQDSDGYILLGEL